MANATTFSITTLAAEIALMSDRSQPASLGSPVRRSTLASGLPSVLIGFITPRTTTGWPFVIPPSKPPALFVGRSNRRPFAAGVDRVVDLRTRPAGGLEAQADLDALERLDREHRLPDPAVEPAVDRHAAAEPDRAAEDVALDHAAGRVLGHLLLPDELPHLAGRRLVGAVEVVRVPLDEPVPPVVLGHVERAAGLADLPDEAERLDPELPQQAPAQSAPAATRAAVSRALARSSVVRQSSVSHFTLPARSAWPGRGRCSGGVFSGSLRRSSLLRTAIVTGLPNVSPSRTPVRNSARSVSIFCRPPRP